MTEPLLLVVDDDADLRAFLALALRGAGYRVEEAWNGEVALSAIRVERPALILLDMRMPVMDGWAFCAALRAEDPAPPPIVVMTAAADPAKRAAEVRADGWLPKPFEYRTLIDIVASFTTRAGHGPLSVGA